MTKKKTEELFSCTAPCGCDRKYHRGAGGTLGEKGLCPGHYQATRRGVAYKDLEPLADRDAAPMVSVKFYLTATGRKALEQRAKKAGISVSALVAQIVDASSSSAVKA